MSAPDISGRSITELLDLTGRVVVVTGGARGIGAAIAARITEAGGTALLWDADLDAAKQAASSLERAEGRGVDVRDLPAVRAAVKAAEAKHGGIDALVNNAGVFPLAAVLEQSDEDWGHVLSVNLDGAMRCSREVAAQMVAASRAGVIVNITSIEAHKVAGPGLSAYVASKHGLLGLTRAMAVELGASGIRVLAVAPTLVDTTAVAEMAAAVEAAGLGGVVEQLRSAVPLGRAAVPDDIARVVLFAVSDMAALMSGSTLVVDAGSMAM